MGYMYDTNTPIWLFQKNQDTDTPLQKYSCFLVYVFKLVLTKYFVVEFIGLHFLNDEPISRLIFVLKFVDMIYSSKRSSLPIRKFAHLPLKMDGPFLLEERGAIYIYYIRRSREHLDTLNQGYVFTLVLTKHIECGPGAARCNQGESKIQNNKMRVHPVEKQ